MSSNLGHIVPQGRGAPDKNKESVIKMQRHSSGAQDPDYTLVIFGDGTLVYEGNKGVKIKGKKMSHLPQSSINYLLKEFMNLYYFDLKDRYEQSSGYDRPTVKTSITIRGKTKSVCHVHGSKAPTGLSKLEDKIDKVTNSYQWTGYTNSDHWEGNVANASTNRT
jgi:Domain of unknown function (DUF6438)